MPFPEEQQNRPDTPSPMHQPVAEDPKRSVAFSWKLWAALVFFGMLLVALRTPMDWLHPTFYAQDGMVFFEQQCIDGWHAIFRAESGSLYLIPRLAAVVMSAAPVEDQPLLYSLFSVVIQSLAASFFFLPENRILVRSDALRLIVCVLALIDFQALEMLNSATYVQWFLFPVAFLMLSHLGSSEITLSRRRVLIYSALMVLICLSTPLLIFAVPLAIFVLVRSPARERLAPGSMIAALAIQAAAFVTTSVPEPKVAQPPLSLFLALRPIISTMGAWVYRDVFTILLGEPAAKLLALHGGETLAAIALVAVVVAICYLSPKFPRTQRFVFISASVISIGLVGTSMVVGRLEYFFGDLAHYNFFGGGARYFYLSGWIMLILGAMAVERQFVNWSHLSRAAILLAIFGLGALSNFAVAELPDEHWSRSAPAIEQWKTKRDRHEHSPRVVAPIFPPGWEVVLPAF